MATFSQRSIRRYLAAPAIIRTPGLLMPVKPLRPVIVFPAAKGIWGSLAAAWYALVIDDAAPGTVPGTYVITEFHPVLLGSEPVIVDLNWLGKRSQRFVFDAVDVLGTDVLGTDVLGTDVLGTDVLDTDVLDTDKSSSP